MRNWLYFPDSSLEPPFVVVGGVGGVMRKSDDAVTWSACTATPASNIQGDIVRVGSTWYTGSFDTKSWSSPDADTFTWIGSIPSPPTAVKHNGTYFLVTSNNTNGRYYKTADMISFSPFTISGFTFIIGTLHWNGTTWLATGNTGEAKTSTDGETWSAGVTAPTVAPGCMNYFGGLWIAGGTGTAGVSSSGDLVTWTDRLDTGAESIYAFARNNTVIVAVGSNGGIYTSTNGTAWTSRTSGTAELLYGCSWSESLGLFIAVGTGGEILTSPTGETWTVETSGTGSDLIAVGGS